VKQNRSITHLLSYIFRLYYIRCIIHRYVAAALIGLSVPDATRHQRYLKALIYDLQTKMCCFALFINSEYIDRNVIKTSNKVVEILLMSNYNDDWILVHRLKAVVNFFNSFRDILDCSVNTTRAIHITPISFISVKLKMMPFHVCLNCWEGIETGPLPRISLV
jgi:hypothetical protein